MIDLFRKNDGHFFAVLRGSAYALFAKVLIIALGFLNNILVARYYGAELVGVLSVVHTLLSLLSLLSLSGLNQSILAIIPKRHIESEYSPFPFVVRVSIYVLVTSFLLSSSIYFGSDVWIKFLERRDQLKTAMLISSFFIAPYALRSLFLSFFRAIDAVKIFSVLQLVTPVANLFILIFIIAYSYAGLWVVYARLISAVVAVAASIVFFVFLFRRVQPSAQGEYCPLNLLLLLKTSLPLCGVSLLVFSTSKISILVYSLFVSEQNVGYYSVAVNTSILINVALGCVNSMVAPKFAELHARKERDTIFSVGIKTTRLICLATIPLTVFLVLLGKVLLEIVYGVDFNIAYVPMIILAIGNCINAIAGPNDIFLQMTGDQGVLHKMMWIGFTVSLLLYGPFIHWGGAGGAALAVVVGQCVWNCLAHIFILKKYDNSLMLFYSKPQ
ncbi:lipopolysaccharide biosynthesis protein [Halodesulfovibrio aestuarii]|uniref:Membrane protein involved in the export of O-antigen and teichoic acid n=1 Tax=Halodesulfovibrio aestuarii TaxID=126333 RepID=A0A8G2CAC8_9BACT|nr:oligosaccharide flippase family protein [Halodesulfovibrio aestuarii]SHJ29253.1 Membrane protein involved in the export of O-antigen and teichoic acid [Halodesulfovibrio aestuarii]